MFVCPTAGTPVSTTAGAPARPSRKRRFARDQAGPNVQTQQGAVAIRTQARHADQNHDIARGILDLLVNNTIGPKGIEVEPQPRLADGSIHREYARDLLAAWRDWTRHPEVTQQFHWGKVQRLLARTWFRDGEAFGQMLTGPIPTLTHGTRVPFSIEMLEPDMIPFDYDPVRDIRQGIETNAWGRPRAYWVYKSHPTDQQTLANFGELKRVPAERIFHVAGIDRIGQVRGVSIFASVINRLEDIKDYEESERVAAKIAAMLTAYVKRNSPDGVDAENLQRDEEGNPVPREIGLEPGAIIDSLQVGEEIDMIDSKRPNPNLVGFRHGQLKALAAGTRTTASSISKTYEGSYSAQRQEMVENWANYAALTDEFVGNVIRPIWEGFVAAANASGVVPRPPDVVDESDALYLGQSMPWIDPLKEANAWHKLVRDGFASEVEVIRKRGANPSDVLEQITDWRDRTRQAGITLESDAGPGPQEMEEARARMARASTRAEADKLVAQARARHADAQAEAELARGRAQVELVALHQADERLKTAEASIAEQRARHDAELHRLEVAAQEARAMAEKEDREQAVARREAETDAALERMAAEHKALLAEQAAAAAERERAAEIRAAAEQERLDREKQASKHAREIQALEEQAARAGLAELTDE